MPPPRAEPRGYSMRYIHECHILSGVDIADVYVGGVRIRDLPTCLVLLGLRLRLVRGFYFGSDSLTQPSPTFVPLIYLR